MRKDNLQCFLGIDVTGPAFNHRRNERSLLRLRDVPYHVHVIVNHVKKDRLLFSVGECPRLDVDADIGIWVRQCSPSVVKGVMCTCDKQKL